MTVTEANYDVSNRPSNAQLKQWGVMQCALSVVVCAVAAPVLDVLILEPHYGPSSIGFAIFGAVIGLVSFFPIHARAGRRKRIAFEACGGDTTGMTDWMLGAMHGHRLPDGRWEWNYPDTPGSSN